jgi:hypothetical protein
LVISLVHTSLFLVFKTASANGLSLGYAAIAMASTSLEASSYTIQNVASLPSKLYSTGGSKKNRGLLGSTSYSFLFPRLCTKITIIQKCIPDNPAPPNSATEEDHTGRSTLDDAHTSKHVAPGRSTCSHAVCPIALEAWELGELCELKWWWALRWAGVGWEPGKEKGEAGIG